MSTVQSLLGTLQFRVDTDADLYHLINTALRLIAKRLYWHKSDLVRSEMELNLYAEVSYAAATIAFVSGTPASITDGASQFVVEGFKAGMVIKTDSTVNPGPYTIASVAAGTITLATGDAVTNEALGSTITITSQNNQVDLPDDFWGLFVDDAEDYPYIDGYRDTLKPLPNQRTRLISDTIGGSVPGYFKVKGRKLVLTPGTGSDITIKGDYFARPTELNGLTDTIPFDEIFDDAICEAVAMGYEKGLSSQVENEGLLQKICFDAVDMVVPQYDQKAPTEVLGGIDWDSYV